MVQIRQGYHRGVFPVGDLGDAFLIDLWDKRCKGRPDGDHIFFDVRHPKRKTELGVSAVECGYMRVTPGMKRVFDSLLYRDRPENRSISFIELDDCYTAVFEDGIYISEAPYAVDKDEFQAWLSPLLEKRGEYLA